MPDSRSSNEPSPIVYFDDSDPPTPSVSTSSSEFVPEVQPEVVPEVQPEVVPEVQPEVVPPVRRRVHFKIEDIYEAPEWNLNACLRRYSLLKREFKMTKKVFRRAFHINNTNVGLYHRLKRVERLSIRKYERVIKKLRAKTSKFDDSYNVAKELFRAPSPNRPEPEHVVVRTASEMEILRLKFERKERFMAKVVATADHMDRIQRMLKRLRRNVPIDIFIFSPEEMKTLVGASIKNIKDILVNFH